MPPFIAPITTIWGSTDRDYGVPIELLARQRRRLNNLRVIRRAWWRSRRGAARFRTQADEIERCCLFVGFPRSGSSLTGQLLNAHRHVVIAHEADVLRFFDQLHLDRSRIIGLLLETDREFVESGATGADGNRYVLPEQAQGATERLRVVGDKKAGMTADRIGRDPEILDRFRAAVGLPLRIVTVVRNPYDNITTISHRHPTTLERAVDIYFRRVVAVQHLEATLGPDEHHFVRFEALSADPRTHVRDLCAFVGVDAPDDYLDACAALVRPDPNRSRTTGDWTPVLIDEVAGRIADVGFLRDYAYDT